MPLAATFNGKSKRNGKWTEITGTIAWDSSYPTGGEDFTGIFSNVIYLHLGQYLGFSFQVDYVNKKILVYSSAGFTPAGTISAPIFTGSALATHRHTLHFQTSAAANAVTAAANQLRTAAAAFDVAGVANSAGEGGIVDVGAGTPAGTNSVPTFTGTAVAQAGLSEVSNATDLSSLVAQPFFVTLFKN